MKALIGCNRTYGTYWTYGTADRRTECDGYQGKADSK